MTDWSQLTHAYGSAEDVPGLFDRIGTEHGSQAWTDLWSALCHQGSVYPASFAALPRLAEIAVERDRPSLDRAQAAVLAGSIVAGEDQAHDAGDVRREYADAIATLQRATGELLHAATASDEYIYFLQAVLAFEGVPVWKQELERLNDEEYEVECPSCGIDLFVAIGSHGYFASVIDYVTKDDVAKTPLRPADPATLQGIGRRLYDTATADGQDESASKLTYLFGTAVCVECGGGFTVADQVGA